MRRRVASDRCAEAGRASIRLEERDGARYGVTNAAVTNARRTAPKAKARGTGKAFEGLR
jgi:hypothetical protein